MRTLLLNLPNKDNIMRRYACSYEAPFFLFPPQELLSLGGIILEWKRQSVKLLDAIAERIDLQATMRKIAEINPTILVTMTGFECFDDDIAVIEQIKKTFPEIKIICFGYYPTIFTREILQKTSIDIILLGEPDIIFSDLYDAIAENRQLNNLPGVAYKDENGNVINELKGRIKNLDDLPFPAYSLLKKGLYSEPFLGRSFTTLQTARGCSYACKFCVQTYGNAVGFQSPEKVFRDIRKLVVENKITHIRFMEDTFTLKRERIIKLCGLINDNNLNITWTALSRCDCLDAEMLACMKRAGCQRIYLGIESGSQRILDYYAKGYKIDDIKDIIYTIKKADIEVGGFFIIGAPHETIVDLEKSIKFAKENSLDCIAVSKLIAYPGTPLYEKLRKEVDFSLFPYKNIFKNGLKDDEIFRWQKRFYREFYFRPTYIAKKAQLIFSKPKESLIILKASLGLLFSKT